MITLPATVTAAPFEYYLEMQEIGEKPVREPAQGAYLATPDLTPPMIVPELTTTVAKSYRVTLGWKGDEGGLSVHATYSSVQRGEHVIGPR